MATPQQSNNEAEDQSQGIAELDNPSANETPDIGELSKFAKCILQAADQSMKELDQKKLDLKDALKRETKLQQLSRLVIDHSLNGVILTDEHFDIIQANKAACQCFSYDEDVFANLNFSTLLNIQELIQANQNKKIGNTEEIAYFDTEAKDSQNTNVPITLSMNTFTDDDDFYYVFIIRDQRSEYKVEQERRELHKQLIEAQKMNAIGMLTSGIAHDFNNLLLAVMGNLEYINEFFGKENEELLEIGQQSMETIERGMELVSNLSTFSRSDDLGDSDIHLNELLENTFKLLKHTIPTYVDLRLTLLAKDAIVRANYTQLEQVIVNVINNAVDSIDDESGCVMVNLLPANDKGFYSILIQDNGCGMKPEVMEKAFEPFFTTKDVGEGTGLGLSSSRGILEQFLGYIEIASEVEQGTAVTVYLPVSKQGEKE